MTKFEKIVVSAYTGILLCDIHDLYEYLKKVMNCEYIYTHNFADEEFMQKVKEKVKPDLLKICEDSKER